MSAVQINQGTQTTIQTTTVGGTETQVMRLDIGSGTNASQFTGYIGIGTSIVTVGTAGSGFWGTLVAASGAGTKQYVQGVDIIGVSGTVEVAITNIGVTGSTGAGVLARGFVPPSGGISKTFSPVIASQTNGTLAYWLGGAGTVDITIQYWQGI